MNELQKQLFAMQDIGYKEFQAKLIPTIHPDTVIGIRTPVLRAFAKKYSKTPEAVEFRKQLPHTYYEENNLHAFLIEEIRDYEECIRALDAFLPYVDNWATCDGMSPKIFKQHKQELLDEIYRWIESKDIYAVRYGIGMLMKYFLDNDFKLEYHSIVANISSEEYYINMMIAWYFATALAKQYEASIRYLEEGRLSKWIHNKTIQKAVESYRITPEQKSYLRTLRIK